MECTQEPNKDIKVFTCDLVPTGKSEAIMNFEARVKTIVSPELVNFSVSFSIHNKSSEN